jgi:hypothetical protein
VRFENHVCPSKLAAITRSRNSVIPNTIGTKCLDETRLGRGQQLREHSEITVASRSELERGVHVDPDHIATRRQPQLSLAGEQHVPGFMFLSADQGVLTVGAEPPVGSKLAAGAGQAVVAAGPAVFGPSTRLEMPAAEGPHPFFATLSNTCRSVNS